LRVTQEEIGKAMIGHARRFPGQEQAVLDFLRKNPQAQESLAAPVLEDKVVDFILEMAQVSERTVAADELLRAADAETTSARNEDAVRS
jgi:trigger factor